MPVFDKWEHQTVAASSIDELLVQIRKSGEDGWELVQVVAAPDHNWVGFLKRSDGKVATHIRLAIDEIREHTSMID